MEIAKEQKDELNAVIKIRFEAKDYKPQVERVLKDYRKNAAMPGFRPGMVPMSIIRKKYELHAKVEEINKLISETLNKFIKESGLQLLGEPLPSKEQEPIDLSAQDAFEFAFDVGISPNFTVNLSSRDKFIFYDIEIDDELMNKNIDDIRKRYGQVKVVEVAKEQDMLQGEFTELDEDGNFKEEGIRHISMVLIEELEEEIKQSLIGMKQDDKIMLDPHKVSREDADLAGLLGIEKNKVKSVGTHFQFKVTNVYGMQPAEINRELFDKVFGENTVKTEEEFRNRVREKLLIALEDESKNKMRKDIVEAHINKLKIKLPDAFLKRWIIENSKKEIAPEKLEEEYERYAEGLKWQLFETKVIAENGLQLEKEEVMAYTKSLIAQQMKQYGQEEIKDEQLTQTAEQLLQKEEESQNIINRLYDKKLIELYKNTCTFKHKTVSYDDFINLATQKSKKFKLFDNISNIINPKNAR